MDSMFDNYNKTKYIPSNLYRFLPVESEYKDLMVLNAINEYSFRIPHKKEDILDANIFYMQGTEHKIQKSFYDIKFTDLPNDRCIAEYYLTPSETLLFNTYNKEVKVQLKVDLINGKIEYSPIFLVKVINSLDKDLQKDGEF